MKRRKGLPKGGPFLISTGNINPFNYYISARYAKYPGSQRFHDPLTCRYRGITNFADINNYNSLLMKKLYSLLLLICLGSFQVMSQGLVVNEVDYDQPSVDSAEFIELYNAGSAPINLSNYTVVLFNGNTASNALYDSIALPATTLNPGSFFVICSGSGKVPLCDLARPTIANMIQNGAPDAVGIRDNNTLSLVDVVSYEGNCNAPYVEGTGVLDADTLQSDSIAGRYLSISRFPDGNDSNNNSVDFTRVCSTPGTANVNTSTNCPAPTGLFSAAAPASISLYPNPSRGIVNIDLKAIQSREVNVTVNNMLGNVVMESVIKNQNGNGQFDLSDFQNGIYIVKVSSPKGQFVQRIVLKK